MQSYDMIKLCKKILGGGKSQPDLGFSRSDGRGSRGLPSSLPAMGMAVAGVRGGRRRRRSGGGGGRPAGEVAAAEDGGTTAAHGGGQRGGGGLGRRQRRRSRRPAWR